MLSITLADIKRAVECLRPVTGVTPALASEDVDARVQASVFSQCENFQRTGSFKFRGAYNAVTSLPAGPADPPIVTVSSGHHGHALALAAKLHGRRVRVYAPGAITEAKRQAIAAQGALVVDMPTRAAAEAEVQALAISGEALLIHPFNDGRVIAGQGTCAWELMTQVEGLDTILAPVGGGGLLSGTCLAAHARDPRIAVYACEPTGALDALDSVRSGRIVPMENPQTIADGLRSSVGTLTLDILRRHLTEFFTVEEGEILEALRFAVDRLKMVMEPSSAVALVPVLRGEPVLRGKRVAVILTGGNIDRESLRTLLAVPRFT